MEDFLVKSYLGQEWIYKGGSHFVTFSAYHRRALLGTTRARGIVISRLDRLERKGMVNVAGFVIMPDHVHALFRFDGGGDPSAVMRQWKGESAHYLRLYYEETSPGFVDCLRTMRSGREIVCMWRRRYNDFNVASADKAREKLDCMHNNPVKAGLVSRASDWPWSSARRHHDGRSVGVNIKPGL